MKKQKKENSADPRLQLAFEQLPKCQLKTLKTIKKELLTLQLSGTLWK